MTRTSHETRHGSRYRLAGGGLFLSPRCDGWGSGGTVVKCPCKPDGFSRFVPAGGVSLPDRTEPHRTANTGDHGDSGPQGTVWGRILFAGLSLVWVGLWVGAPPKSWVGASQNEVMGR